MRFLRGLGILLPTVLTIWILVAAYRFVEQRIADPINDGVQRLVLRTTAWPRVEDEKVNQYLTTEQRQAREDGDLTLADAVRIARREKLLGWWKQWPGLNLIGLFIAIILIYFVGLLLGSYIGRRLYTRGEEWLARVPVFKAVYPYVKQVTDFFVGEKADKLKFSNVVAVEYPRKGIWSLGLVTGDTMRTIEQKAGAECMTIFVPSSPTPFTGYVITVPRRDTINLDITIDEALRFSVSGGVIVPATQVIHHGTPSGQLGAGRSSASSDAGRDEDDGAGRSRDGET